jgi:hypothetical protein
MSQACVWLVCVAGVCGWCVWLVCVAGVCGWCVWLVCVAGVSMLQRYSCAGASYTHCWHAGLQRWVQGVLRGSPWCH